MISKNQIKGIRQLEQKKHRQAAGLFVAEGPKVVGDLLAKHKASTVVATRKWLDLHPAPPAETLLEVDEDELRRVSFLQHPQQVLATFPLPSSTMETTPSTPPATGKLSLALDGVQDPGNVGTIIRIADWFGVDTIYCSRDTADAYSPKVVQATMGSIARVRMIYTDLCTLIDHLPQGTPVYGTLLDGDDLYTTPLLPHGLLIMGNEGNGISDEVASRLTHRLLIPAYPDSHDTVDSLNVAIATAVCCAEMRRRQRMG